VDASIQSENNVDGMIDSGRASKNLKINSAAA
jgi:hypothetical protein